MSSVSAVAKQYPQETESLPVHVAACLERHKAIDSRLKRVELAIYSLLVVVMTKELGLLSVLPVLLGVK